MTPADKRVLDLLDRWLTSIELHLKYVDLDEPGYRQVQPWPAHERPARWILELAQQKVLQLKSLCKAQIASNDPVFAESLELMGFLANLVGAQNINRFIPLADPAREQSLPANEQTPVVVETKSPAAVATETPTVQPVTPAEDSTRELPRLKAGTTASAKDPDRTREMPKLKIPARQAAGSALRAVARVQPRHTTKAAAPAQNGNSNATGNHRAQEIVIADAVRLLKWGKDWHELTELIARMAERPAPAEIRRILRTCRQRIESQLNT